MKFSIVELAINIDFDDQVRQFENGRLICKKEEKLSLYRQFFEKRFLEETMQYYSRESQKYIQNSNVIEYMKKVIFFGIEKSQTVFQ